MINFIKKLFSRKRKRSKAEKIAELARGYGATPAQIKSFHNEPVPTPSQKFFDSIKQRREERSRGIEPPDPSMNALTNPTGSFMPIGFDALDEHNRRVLDFGGGDFSGAGAGGSWEPDTSSSSDSNSDYGSSDYSSSDYGGSSD